MENHEQQEGALWISTGQTARDDDPIFSDDDLSDPVGARIERAALDTALRKSTVGDPDWDALLGTGTTPAPLAKRAAEEHPDGTEVEKSGAVTWSYTYKDGALIRQECLDPDLPGNGRLVFDGDGELLTA